MHDVPRHVLLSGIRLRLQQPREHVLELVFDAEDRTVNLFDLLTLSEFEQALDRVEQSLECRALILSSAKHSFFGGGDINEFSNRFQQSDTEIRRELMRYHGVLNRLEDLPCVTLCALSGAAIGGGLEIALACDHALAIEHAEIGFPEVTLGLIPGTGGTVRLSRLLGAQPAIDWICHGRVMEAQHAPAGTVAATVHSVEALQELALMHAQQAKLDEALAQIRQRKYNPAPQSPDKTLLNRAKAALTQEFHSKDPSLPARITAAETICKLAPMAREEAQSVELDALIELGRSPQCRQLVEAFLHKH